MNSLPYAQILCQRPLGSEFADRIDAALSDPAIGAVFIDFEGQSETEELEVDQILSGDPLIDRLRTLIRQMELSPKIVAALVRESIGGLQLEIALACDVRFAAAGTISLDFPWLKYGLMPILGGTQRLPRLSGFELAARILLQAEKVSVLETAASGLFQLADKSLIEAAREWTETHPRPGQPWDRIPQELSLSYSQRPVNRQLLEKIYLHLRQRLSPEEAAPTAVLRCFQEGLERSIDAGIRLEAEQWSVVRHSRSTRNRVNTLYITRRKALHNRGNLVSPLRQLGVLGAGLMGTGIAYTAARAGCKVVVVDLSPEASERSLQQMKKIAQQDAGSGLLLREGPTDLLNRVRWSTEIGVLGRCDFIVEAIFERENLKKEKLAEIAALADPEAIIASNTTTLPISDLALACNYPERFLGTHFFAPVHRMELLEIVVGAKTVPQTVARALQLAKALGKIPIIVRDGPGFFTSRVVAAYLQEALFMLREGVSPWTIDHVAENAGMILGPLAMADLMSLDLLADILKSLAKHQRGAARDATDAVRILEKFTSKSRLGRKSSAGIYAYSSRQERVESAEVRNWFPPASYRSGPLEIEQRLFAVQTIEALHAMREGIIEDPAMADLASVLGWSYPAARGGVMGYLDFIGQEEFERLRARLQKQFGNRFAMPG